MGNRREDRQTKEDPQKRKELFNQKVATIQSSTEVSRIVQENLRLKQKIRNQRTQLRQLQHSYHETLRLMQFRENDRYLDNLMIQNAKLSRIIEDLVRRVGTNEPRKSDEENDVPAMQQANDVPSERERG